MRIKAKEAQINYYVTLSVLKTLRFRKGGINSALTQI
jgi:hypothetical protein